MSQPMTRRELILRNLRSTALWLSVTAPVFAVTAVATFATLGWGAIVIVPFVAGPIYLLFVAGLSQKTLPEAGWLWFLVLCFAGAGSAFMGVLLFQPLRGLFADSYDSWLWSFSVAGGAWVMPTLFNLGYLLSFSDEECAILTRAEARRETCDGRPRSSSAPVHVDQCSLNKGASRRKPSDRASFPMQNRAAPIQNRAARAAPLTN